MKLPGHAVFASYQTYTKMLSELLENKNSALPVSR